jgi:hypothetical protein
METDQRRRSLRGYLVVRVALVERTPQVGPSLERASLLLENGADASSEQTLDPQILLLLGTAMRQERGQVRDAKSQVNRS